MKQMFPNLLLLPLALLISCSNSEVADPVEFEVNIAADSIVFAQIGDFGEAGEAENAVSELVKSWEPDFIVSVGDGNYNNGKYTTLSENITQYYGDYIYNYDAPPSLRCNGKAFEEQLNRFFSAPGNHDLFGAAGLIPYYDFFTLPGNESYYTFSWGPVDFYSLNTIEGDLDLQKAWLEDQLTLSVHPFHIVFFHNSPYSSGEHGNYTGMQWDFHSMGIDLVITGHDHIFERSEKKGQEGTYYIVNGLGGRAVARCNVNPLPGDLFTTYCYCEDYGAMKVTATKEKLVVEFFDKDSPDLPVDHFEILK